LTLLENIRLGWNGLPWTKTLACYENSLTTDQKSFITLAPGIERSLTASDTLGSNNLQVQLILIKSGKKILDGKRNNKFENKAQCKHE
jgi:hypothetical protein